ncbi:MAG: DUF3800 domain-containing protein [Gammaproteobacteria bacterium]
MNTAFLFLDECMYAPLDFASLTGVLVPADRYAAVRDEMCRLAIDVQPSPPNGIPPVIEFHGQALLKNEDLEKHYDARIDSVRLSVYQRVVDILCEHQLSVCRITYLNRKEVDILFQKQDPNLYSLTFFGMQAWLEKFMADTLIIPVMDGIPDTGGVNAPNRSPRVNTTLIRAFARTVRTTHHLRQFWSDANSLSFANSHNLAEPVFADSAHSVLIQVVDLVSHMLLQVERAEHQDESKLNDYRRDVLKIARKIPSKLIHRWAGKMTRLDG